MSSINDPASRFTSLGLELQSLTRSALAAVANKDETQLVALVDRRRVLVAQVQDLALQCQEAARCCPALAEALRLEKEFLKVAAVRREELWKEWQEVRCSLAIRDEYA